MNIEEFESLKIKCATLEKELSNKKTECEVLIQKCADLELYKNNKENENMRNTIKLALNSVSHILNSDQISKWRKESEKCSSENVDGFINNLKAFAFDIQEKNGIPYTESIRNALPRNTETKPNDLWERIEKKYN